MTSQPTDIGSLANNTFTDSSGPQKKRIEDFEFVERKTRLGNTSELGRGSYGVVRLVKDKETQKQYAMKIVRMGLLNRFRWPM